MVSSAPPSSASQALTPEGMSLRAPRAAGHPTIERFFQCDEETFLTITANEDNFKFTLLHMGGDVFCTRQCTTCGHLLFQIFSAGRSDK